ncbi:MAG: hypothetical protein MUC49_15525 [Raineya sp.]|jgi:hypothetical protein|nr:hypothetical protein [Raineya sp.]
MQQHLKKDAWVQTSENAHRAWRYIMQLKHLLDKCKDNEQEINKGDSKRRRSSKQTD